MRDPQGFIGLTHFDNGVPNGFCSLLVVAGTLVIFRVGIFAQVAVSSIVATLHAPRLILGLSSTITELCEANGFGPDGDPSFGGDNVSDGHDEVLGNPAPSHLIEQCRQEAVSLIIGWEVLAHQAGKLIIDGLGGDSASGP